jgi:hypothetical protein
MTTPRLRLMAQVSAQAESLSERILARMRAEIPLYAQRDPADLRPAVHTSLQGILRPLAEGRPLTDAELAAFHAYGDTRARQDIPTEEMLRAWRLSIRSVRCSTR